MHMRCAVKITQSMSWKILLHSILKIDLKKGYEKRFGISLTENSNVSFAQTQNSTPAFSAGCGAHQTFTTASGDKANQSYTENRRPPFLPHGSLQSALVCRAPRSETGRCRPPAVALCQHDQSPRAQSARLHASTCSI